MVAALAQRDAADESLPVRLRPEPRRHNTYLEANWPRPRQRRVAASARLCEQAPTDTSVSIVSDTKARQLAGGADPKDAFARNGGLTCRVRAADRRGRAGVRCASFGGEGAVCRDDG